MYQNIYIESFDAFYNYDHDAGYIFDGHAHDSWEINIVLEGAMRATCNDSAILLTKGDFWVAAPWVFHCFKAMKGGVKRIVISFFTQEAVSGPDYSARAMTEEEHSLCKLCVEEFETICSRYGLIKNGAENRFANCKRLCEVMLSRVYGAENEAIKNHSSRAQIYRETVRYMERHISAKLSIDDLSKEMMVSAALLKNIFKEYTDGGVIDYFIRLKIRYAQELLEQGASIAYVSDTLGFSSQNYFTTVFRKIMGEPPKRFQKRLFERNSPPTPQ